MPRFDKKVTPKILCFIIQRLAQFATYQEAADAVNEEFEVHITKQCVAAHAWKQKKTIAKVRDNFCRNILAIPIANKSFRLQALGNIYRKSHDKEIKIKALRAACAEIGEKFDKIADAIAKSGGDNIVTIIHNEAAQRRITEAAGVCGFTRVENSN